ncbi:MAG: histidine kinase [Candidatus Aminicenantes bacterium]|nr:histidine kinase [Candidatus Aminicenantes bacterium]
MAKRTKKNNRLKKNPFLVWVLVFLFLTLLAMVNFIREVTSELAEGDPGKAAFYFIMETTGAYTILFLLPVLIFFFNRFPLKKNNLAVRIPLYLFASMIFGASHTLLMYITRTIIFRLVGWGPYDYGVWKFRFTMEYSHQFITFITVYILFVFFRSLRKKQEQKLKMARLEEKLANARFQTLQMQLNPHFFFNTLNMISSMMYEDIKTADKMIADLSDILRITLKSSKGNIHTLEKELEILRLYIEIMKARFHDKLFIHTDIAVNTEKALLPRFLLQPLVENSIKHSLESPGKTEVTVTARRKGGRLILKIIDNGPGLPEGQDTILSRGIGLTNTMERLEQLYGKNQELLLQNREKGGLIVRISIPFETTQGKE